jgi:putative SOS response-associated peptidase YedK
VCGRYSLAVPDLGLLRERFPLGDEVEIRPRFNIAPGDEVLAVTTDREGQPRGELLRWGLVPPWSGSPAGGAKMINARAETVAERPAYRKAFERFRCLIIADGFYEWRRIEGGRKEAFHITRVGRAPFAFAGLWSVWHRGEPDAVRSCSIITTAANPSIAMLHDRMPVILSADQEDAWLDRAMPVPALHDLLHGLGPEQTELRQVGPAVNDARYDGPECLADAGPSPQAALF